MEITKFRGLQSFLGLTNLSVSFNRGTRGSEPYLTLDGNVIPHEEAKKCVDFETGYINITIAERISEETKMRIRLNLILDNPYFYLASAMSAGQNPRSSCKRKVIARKLSYLWGYNENRTS